MPADGGRDLTRRLKG